MSSKSEKGVSAYRKLLKYQTVKILYKSKYLDFRTFMATLTDYILLS